VWRVLRTRDIGPRAVGNSVGVTALQRSPGQFAIRPHRRTKWAALLMAFRSKVRRRYSVGEGLVRQCRVKNVFHQSGRQPNG